MPNPNRPQYQDTIEETWGQAVADTVVRRYANTADRDADLAGFTPAELNGQLIVIAPGGGVTPILEQHDGASWVRQKLLACTSNDGGMTDANGYLSLNFPKPFPSPPAVTVSPRDPGFSGFMCIHAIYADSFMVRGYHGGGAPAGNVALVFDYIAMWPIGELSEVTDEPGLQDEGHDS
jgi:hypothetical protein